MSAAAAVAVVADDLTGAADTAGQLVAAGHPSEVWLEFERSAAAVRCPAIDVDARDASAGTASRRVHAAFASLAVRCPGSQPFLKIDSTLRGHVAASIRAAAAAVAAAVVVASPAFPERGRTVVGGDVHVDGDVLAGVSWPSIVETVRRSGIDVVSADVRCRADLDDLVAIGQQHPSGRALWVGAAAMAAALGRVLPAPPSAPVHRERCARVVVMAGSFHQVTAAQLDDLAASGEPAEVMSGRALRSCTLAELRCGVGDADGLVLTGGATARAVLSALGVRRLIVGGEVEPGIPWAIDPDSGRRVVTKAGGFGDRGALRRAVAFLG